MGARMTGGASHEPPRRTDPPRRRLGRAAGPRRRPGRLRVRGRRRPARARRRRRRGRRARPAAADQPSAARILDILGVDAASALVRHAARPDAGGTPPTSSSPRRAWRPDQPLLAAAAAGRRPGLGRGRARLADAAGRGRGALAHRHRHERQDHDGADARLDPAGGRPARAAAPATSARRCSRPCCTRSPTTSWPSSCRASSSTGRSRSRRGPSAVPQRRARPPRLARRLPSTPRPRARSTSDTEVACVYNVQDDARPSTSSRRPTSRRAAVQSASPSASRARRWSASSTTCSPTAPSSSSGAPQPPSWHAGRPARRPARRAPRTSSPTRWPPPRWPGRTACPPGPSRAGLRAFTPEPHRIAEVGTVEGVRWVDDSKATNPHAARPHRAHSTTSSGLRAACSRAPTSTTSSSAAADRLRGVVLLGADRAPIADALARHAPDVPVVDVRAHRHWCHGPRGEGGRASSPTPGDVVLLAPAAASMDMFTDYGARGDAFVAAVRRLAAGE